jgi:hypothetical protein
MGGHSRPYRKHMSRLLAAFNARRDRIVLRGRILLHLLPHRCFMPVRMLCRLYLVMHMLRPLCLGKSNGYGKREQGTPMILSMGVNPSIS